MSSALVTCGVLASGTVRVDCRLGLDLDVVGTGVVWLARRASEVE
jgi:hypothetical protein